MYGNVVEVHLPELTTTATVPGLQGITMTITTTFDGGNLNYELTFTNPDAAAHENQSGVPEPLITERSEQFRVADQWVVAVSYTPVGGGPTTTYNYVQGSDGAEYYYSGTAQAWFVSDQNGPWRESEAPPPGDFAAN